MPIPYGLQFENDFFGCEIRRETKMPDWCPIYQAIKQTKKIQWSRYQWNPAAPRTKIAMSVFNAVRQNLPARYRKWLLLYCSIDTGLDWYFATDMFFVLHDIGRGREGIVTIDLTLQSEKELQKSDLYLSWAHIKDQKKIETVGRFIAELLLERLGLK